MEKQVTNEQLLDQSNENLRNSLYHVMPGSIVSYDASTQTATVQPMVNDVRTDLTTGARVSEPFPQLSGIPIAWPRFGKFVVAGRLNQYDPVLLIAFDLDPSAWQAKASATNDPVDPPDVRRHGGHYWLAYPCDLRANPIKGASVAAAALYVGLDGGDPVIVINDSTIQLGSSSADAAALASKVNDMGDKLAQALNGHVHVSAAPGVPTGPAGTSGSSGVAPPVTGATPATAPVGPLASTASSLVKLQK